METTVFYIFICGGLQDISIIILNVCVLMHACVCVRVKERVVEG